MDITASAGWLNSAFSFFDQSITLAVHQLYEFGGVVKDTDGNSTIHPVRLGISLLENN